MGKQQRVRTVAVAWRGGIPSPKEATVKFCRPSGTVAAPPGSVKVN